MIQKDTKKIRKNPEKRFICAACDYNTSDKKDFRKHLATRKHKRIHEDTKNPENPEKSEAQPCRPYSCEVCGRAYKFHSGLWRHRKKEHPAHKPTMHIGQEQPEDPILQCLQEVTKGLRQVAQAVKTPNVLDLSKTQNISINVFLNEHCKDAMKLTDFLDNIQVSIPDLMRTKEVGYIAGISSILLKSLKGLPAVKRPIHCSDPKRLKFYVKGDAGWDKDSGEEVNKAIDNVTKRQIDTLQEWQQQNPGFIGDPETLEEWHLMISRIMGGVTDEQRSRNKKAICKHVGENTVIKTAMKEVDP